MAAPVEFVAVRATPGSRKHMARAWTVAELAVEFKMPIERIRSLMADVKQLNEGRPAQYLARDFLDRFVERALEAQGAHSKTAISAKRRTEEARAQKLEIGNARDMKDLILNAEIIPAMVDFISILARALEAAVMRVKRKHPDIKPAYLAAFEENMAIARNTAIDNFERLVEQHELNNRARWDEVREDEEKRLEASLMEHEQMERMLAPTVVSTEAEPDEW